VGHLRHAGFPVSVIETADMDAIKKKYRVPPSVQSCHTGLADGYVIEGHVPADLIDRLVRERPNVVGLSVPGMPPGSPGMEIALGEKHEPYQVVTFDALGRTTVFATR